MQVRDVTFKMTDDRVGQSLVSIVAKGKYILIMTYILFYNWIRAKYGIWLCRLRNSNGSQMFIFPF